MIEKENDYNEKDLRFIKIVANIVVYSIIGVCFLFTFLVTKVDAYTTAKSNIWVNGQRCITNDWDGLGTLSCINNSVTWYNARTDVNLAMTSGKKYTFFYRSTIKVPFSNTNYASNLNVLVSYKRGSTLGDMTSCTTTQSHTITYNSTNPTANKLVTHEVAVACQGVSFSSATDGIVIRAQIDNSGNVSAPIQVKLTQIYLDQDTADNSDVTNAIDNAMQSIINNNNNNTQNIINSNNQTTNAVNNNTNAINNNTQAVEDINDTLTDSSVDNPSNSLNGLNNYFGSNGVISDLLLLPVSLYSAIINNINGTCQSFTLGTLYGHTLVLPCINISTWLGSALYGTIDLMFSGFFIMKIRKKFVDIFNHFTSLEVGGNELE